MGKQDTSLPLLRLTGWKDGVIIDIREGRFGHNALFSNQNAQFKEGVDYVTIKRVKEKDGK